MTQIKTQAACIKVLSEKLFFGNGLNKLKIICNDEEVTRQFLFGDSVEFSVPAGEVRIKAVATSWIFTYKSDALLLDLKPGTTELVSLGMNAMNTGLSIKSESAPIAREINYWPIVMGVGIIVMAGLKVSKWFE